MKLLGYLYLHAPDPENPGQFVTYPIAVEVDDDSDAVSDDEEEVDDEPA
jgi:hypothetical protein